MIKINFNELSLNTSLTHQIYHSKLLHGIQKTKLQRDLQHNYSSI